MTGSPWFNILHPDAWVPEDKSSAALPAPADPWHDHMAVHAKNHKREAFLRWCLQHFVGKDSFTTANRDLQYGFAQLAEQGLVRCGPLGPVSHRGNPLRTQADWLRPGVRPQTCHLTDEGALQLRIDPRTSREIWLAFSGKTDDEDKAEYQDRVVKFDKRSRETRDSADLKRYREEAEQARFRKLLGDVDA